MTDTAISAAPAPGALPAIVLWPAFGPAHFPRPGKWPVMPVARCGAALKPTGFFDRNPTPDVPPPGAHCAG